MRNLKKVLALVLAMAMALSLAVTAGAAYKTFPDQEQIKNDEAVFLLNALDIVEGRETGKFDPTANLNRAEAAKLVAALNLAGVPVPNANGISSFEDVLGDGSVAWANDYIEYGVAQGSINGMGEGIFAPKANVTGVQFAKMLLGILGYDAAAEKFVGVNWEYYVNTTAVKAGLYDELAAGFDATAALTRDDAAQMMYNALFAKTVIYLTDTTGALKLTNKILMQDIYPNVTFDDAVMTAAAYDVEEAEYTYTVGGKALVTAVDYTAMLGMNVMYVLDGSDVLGMYAYENGAVVTGLWGEFDRDQLIDDELYVAGTTKEVRFETTCKNDIHSVDLTTAKAPSQNACDYSEYKAIDNNDDGTFDYVIVYRVHFETVTHVNSDRVLTTGNSYDFDDNTIYAGAAKDDAVTVVYDSSLKTQFVVEEVAAQSGVINTVRADNGQVYEVVIGGTTYDFCANDCVLPSNLPARISNWPGLTVDYYVVNGYLASVKVDYSLSRDYLLITSIDDDYNVDGYSVQANVLFGDNTTEEITIASLDGEKGWDIIAEVLPYMEQSINNVDQIGYLARYEVTEDGKYELTSTYKLDQMVEAGVADLGFTKTAAWYDGAPVYVGATDNTKEGYILAKNDVVRIADDALVFLVDESNGDIVYSAVSGADIKNMTNWYADATINYVGYEFDEATGFNYATLIYVQTDLEFMSGDITGIIVSEPKFETNEDDSFVYFDLYDGEETYQVQAVNEPGMAGPSKGDVITFRVDDGKLQMVKPVKGDSYAITAYDPDAPSGFATIGLSDNGTKAGEEQLTFAEDAQIIFFDSEDCVPAEGVIAISDKDADGNYYQNTFAVIVDGEVTLLIVDPVIEGTIIFNKTVNQL